MITGRGDGLACGPRRTDAVRRQRRCFVGGDGKTQRDLHVLPPVVTASFGAGRCNQQVALSSGHQPREGNDESVFPQQQAADRRAPDARQHGVADPRSPLADALALPVMVGLTRFASRLTSAPVCLAVDAVGPDR